MYKLAPGFLSPRSIDTLKSTLVNNKTVAQQKTFEQFSLKMSRKHKVVAYLDDSSLCGEIFVVLSWVSDTGEKWKFQNVFVRLINSQLF